MDGIYPLGSSFQFPSGDPLQGTTFSLPHPAGYNISSRIPYRIKNGCACFSFGDLSFHPENKGTKSSLRWDPCLFSQGKSSFPFYVAAVSLSLSHCLAWAVWSLHAWLPQVASKVLEGRAALFSASSIAAMRRCSHPQGWRHRCS